MELSNSTGLIIFEPIAFYLDDLFTMLIVSGSSWFPKALCRQCFVSRLSYWQPCKEQEGLGALQGFIPLKTVPDS